MRMSCNGCRVLRKGCGEDCTIRPCLEWILSPDAQANATVFLAKFYGRAGLLNLLAAGPDALRPALFRSLLYEACGRMVNPVYGSVGLLSSGHWEACQAAVEAVLKGRPVVRVDADADQATPPFRAYDIRHVAKTDPAAAAASPDAAADPHLGVSRSGRTKFKRASSSAANSKKTKTSSGAEHDDVLHRAPSHEESGGSHVEDGGMAVDRTREEEPSEDTEVDAGSHVSHGEDSHVTPVSLPQVARDDEIGLELTLGFQPAAPRVVRSPPARFDAGSSTAESSGHIGLLLELPVR